MKKEEVLKFINDCENSEEKPFGYMVVAISREDIVSKFGALVHKFDILTKEEKENVLSEIANEMNENYQENQFGFEFSKALSDYILD